MSYENSNNEDYFASLFLNVSNFSNRFLCPIYVETKQIDLHPDRWICVVKIDQFTRCAQKCAGFLVHICARKPAYSAQVFLRIEMRAQQNLRTYACFLAHRGAQEYLRTVVRKFSCTPLYACVHVFFFVFFSFFICIFCVVLV